MLPNGLHPATAMDAGLGCRGRPAQRVAGGCQKDSYGDRYCLIRSFLYEHHTCGKSYPTYGTLVR